MRCRSQTGQPRYFARNHLRRARIACLAPFQSVRPVKGFPGLEDISIRALPSESMRQPLFVMGLEQGLTSPLTYL